MTTGTRKGRVPSVSQVPCWQWLITQYLISWDPITYYAECGTNKLESTVSRLIDDTPNPAFVCSNVPMLVTTTKARSDNAVCHSDGELPASCLSRQRKHSFLVFVCASVCGCVCVLRTCVIYVCVCVKIYCWRQSKICQVVGPIKGRSPLLTPGASWFLTKGERGYGAISWLKTKQWWMKLEGGCSSQCLTPLQIFFNIYNSRFVLHWNVKKTFLDLIIKRL